MTTVLNETYLTKKGSLADLRLQDSKLKAEVSEAVIGTPNLDLSSSEVSQLTLQILDPTFSRYKTGLYALNTAMSFGDHQLEIAATGITGDTVPIIELTARSAGVQKLRRAKGPQVVPNISPTEYARISCRDVGLLFVGQDSPKQPQIVRGGGAAGTNETQDEESTWDVIQRLAAELGYVAFEARGTVYFGKPSWLIHRPGGAIHTVRYPKATLAGEVTPFGVPTCRKSVDATKNAVTVDVVVDIEDALRMAPGDLLSLKGVPSFEALYMIDNLSIDIDGVSPVTVQASTPIDPEPQPPMPPDSYGDGGGSGGIVGAVLADLFDLPVSSDGGIGLTAPTTAPSHRRTAGVKGFIFPTTGTVGSRFGPRRSPGGIGSTNHKGIDIRAYRGSMIKASRGGRVSVAGWAGGYGIAVYIDHGDGLQTRYAHMKHHVVRVGQHVAQGQAIGAVNSTGRSTGDHLHFEIRINGVARDPMPYLTGQNDRAG